MVEQYEEQIQAHAATENSDTSREAEQKSSVVEFQPPPSSQISRNNPRVHSSNLHESTAMAVADSLNVVILGSNHTNQSGAAFPYPANSIMTVGHNPSYSNAL